MPYFELMGFGPLGWGPPMLAAAAMTFAVAVAAMGVGAIFGTVGAAAKLSRSRIAQAVADGYTTILRGVPDLLVIYLFYFGGSAAVTAVGRYFGAEGFIGMPAFLTG